MLERRGAPRSGPPSVGTVVHDTAGRPPAPPATAVHDGAAHDDPGSVTLDGRYRLGEVLGRGGMATVLRAYDVVLEREVAVKLFPWLDEDADELARQAAEIQVLAALDHPSLVTLFDAGSVPGPNGRQVYLVMELVDGPTLAERLTHGPLSVPEALVLAHQLADALAVVHESQVVHRDVKPGNVLLTSATSLHDRDPRTAPVVKLADFGIARLAGATRLTMTGVTIGTMRYLSPEQAAGGPVGAATDVYALGLVLIECLSGAPAFAGTLAESAAVRLTTGPTIPAQADPGLAALLSRMTAPDPADRPTAREVAAATAPDGPHGHLDLAATALMTPASGSPRTAATRPVRHEPSSPRSRSRVRRRWAAAVGAVLLASGAVVVGLQVSGAGEPPTVPSYPSVDGDLGDALTSLQQSVAP